MDYDSYGNVIESSIFNSTTDFYSWLELGFMTTSASYSHEGNYLASTTDSRGKVTSYSHDTGKGLLSYIQDANGNKVSYTYDNRGRVTGVQVKDSGNVARGELSYDYGANGLSELDSGSTVYTLSYDAFGNASTIEIGTTTLVSYTYDVNNGNLLRTTYANGFYTDYEYDELERVKTVRENGTIIYTCTYDADGNVNCIDDRKWSVLQQYEYDSIGRLVRMEQKSKSVYQEWKNLKKEVTSDSTSQVETVKYVAPDMTQNYAYSYFTYTDLIGSVTLPNNAHIRYGYDAMERSTGSTLFMGKTQRNYVELTYEGNEDELTTTELVSSMRQSVSNTTFGYTYDDVGNILTVTKNGSAYMSYEYDAKNQLVRENNQPAGKSYRYVYDDCGNLTAKYQINYTTAATSTLSWGNSVANYTYGDANWGDKLTAYNNTTISYDASGNPTNWGDALELTWNGRQLMNIYYEQWETSYNEDVLYFQYNSDGVRVLKDHYNNVNQTSEFTSYVLDGSRILQETREEFYYGTGETVSSEIIQYYYDAGGDVVGLRYNNADYYYEKNLQGDIIGIFDTDGNVVVNYAYDAWGRILSVGGTMAWTLGQINPFRYRSYYYDVETGFYSLQSRYYDPEIGRFINADGEIAGVGSVQGNNLFQYCFNNPVNMSDPTGQWPSWGQVFTAVVGVAIVAVAVAAVVTAGPVLAAAVAVGYTSGIVAAGGTIACASVAAVCGGSLVGEAITGKNPVRDLVGQENFDAITAISTAGAVQGMSNLSSLSGLSSPGTKNNSKLEKYVNNPEKIKNVPVAKIEKIAIKEGLPTGTLSRGSHAGQGFKVTWGGDRLLQYHPGGGHHGRQSYWKVSSGNGTIRIFNDK